MMPGRLVLSDYLNRALSEAEFEELEDGSYAGRIPSCAGVLAFGATLKSCQDELRSTLEDWISLGIKLGHPLPKLAATAHLKNRG
jgi:predicted RNase H-like HicB family nuclease